MQHFEMRNKKETDLNKMSRYQIEDVIQKSNEMELPIHGN